MEWAQVAAGLSVTFAYSFSAAGDELYQRKLLYITKPQHKKILLVSPRAWRGSALPCDSNSAPAPFALPP